MTYPIGDIPPGYRVSALETSLQALRDALCDAERIGKRTASRRFWAGVVFGGLLTGATFIASAAWSLDISGSSVTLEPSADPAAFADVVFVNNLSNGPGDTGAYTLAQDGLVIEARFAWDASFIGADQITVTPPAGMTCQPTNCSVTVIEGQTGRVTLMPFVGS